MPESNNETYSCHDAQGFSGLVGKSPELGSSLLAEHERPFETDKSTEILLDANDGPLQSDDPLVAKALEVIWNNREQRVSIEMVVGQVGCIRRTLERHFRNDGRTLFQELTACRIQQAKRLLCETKLPAKCIAEAAGFSSPTNLYKVFKREVGITPGEFRESESSK